MPGVNFSLSLRMCRRFPVAGKLRLDKKLSCAAAPIKTATSQHKQHRENNDDDPQGIHELSPLGENLAEFGPEQMSAKKADVVEHPEVFIHVGLLFNGPSRYSGVPFS
jgi:hypothetical protein